MPEIMNPVDSAISLFTSRGYVVQRKDSQYIKLKKGEGRSATIIDFWNEDGEKIVSTTTSLTATEVKLIDNLFNVW